MPQLNYAINMSRGVAGTPANERPRDVVTGILALLAQISTVTIAGTASDGDYTITLTDAVLGQSITATFTRGSGETNTQIAAGLRDAVNALGSPWNDRVVATSAAGVVTLTFVVTGRPYTVAAAAPGSGTATPATTQAAGGTAQRPGFFVSRVLGSTNTLRPLASGDDDEEIFGLVERPLGQLEQAADGSDDVFPVGSTVPIVRQGVYLVAVEEAVTPESVPHIRKIATGTEVLGAVRGSADASDTISLAGKARFVTAAAAGELAELEFDLRYQTP